MGQRGRSGSPSQSDAAADDEVEVKWIGSSTLEV